MFALMTQLSDVYMEFECNNVAGIINKCNTALVKNFTICTDKICLQKIVRCIVTFILGLRSIITTAWQALVLMWDIYSMSFNPFPPRLAKTSSFTLSNAR